MGHRLPTELFLPTRPGSVDAVEHVCALATTNSHSDAVAVAVAPSNVSRASDLLFGTGIGIVSVLDDEDPSNFIGQARLSVATGATEVALPAVVFYRAAIVMDLKSFLGSTTPLTVDITTPEGNASLDHAEHALVLGADYVAYAPTATATNTAGQTANLVALIGELQLGGLKVASTSDHHLVALHNDDWAMTPGNSRLCVAVSLPDA